MRTTAMGGFPSSRARTDRTILVLPLTAPLRVCPRASADTQVVGGAVRIRPPGERLAGLTPSTGQRQLAVGVILIVSFFCGAASGIVTSRTPFLVFALIFVASTPAGSAIER